MTKDLPLEELLKDRADAIEDIYNCTVALKQGIPISAGISNEWRRDQNLRQIAVIDDEIIRRQTSPPIDEHDAGSPA